MTPTYNYNYTDPFGMAHIGGVGSSFSIVANLPGTYIVNFFASANRECPPADITIGPETVSTLDLQSVEWVVYVPSGTCSPNLMLDNCPNNGGRRIFPGKLSPSDSCPTDRSNVTLRATLSQAMSGCSVEFRVFDVDDPFDQNNAVLTNVTLIDSDTSGPDNRGSGGVGTYTASTDSNGVAEVTVTVSMQPGDNFRAAASAIPGAASGTTQAQVDTNTPPVNVKFTQMLTVWRKLHVETDSMAPVTGNEIDVPFTDFSGTGTSLTEIRGTGSLDDGSKDLDDIPPENGRFENGTLFLGTSPNDITIFSITGNGNQRVAFPTASIAGLPFFAIDNDLFGNETMSGTITEVTKSVGNFEWTLSITAQNEFPIDWPDFVGGTVTVGGGADVSIVGVNAAAFTLTTNALNIPCIIKDDDDDTLLPKMPDTGQLVGAFVPAYVVPVFDVGDSNMAVPFVLNVDNTNAAVSATFDWDSRALNSPDFWVAYILEAYQYTTVDKDADPDSEGGTFGVTALVGQSAPFTGGGSLIYLEIHQIHEGTTNPTSEEQDTIIHETGHAVGNSRNEPVTDGLLRFTSLYLNEIRSSTKPAS